MNDLEHNELLNSIKDVLLQARQRAYRAVNTAMVQAYWEIGRLIVEDEQKGEQRAVYGQELINKLSKRLTKELGDGFSIQSLKNMRQFFMTFPELDYSSSEKSSALWSFLSWSHFRVLMRVENPKARMFYMEEAASQHWSVRALERQVYSFYYERLLSSQYNSSVIEEARQNTSELASNTTEFIKNPYVLEFLNLELDAKYNEKEIEQAIITHIQKFLLEMGKGYAFVARQKHIRTELSDYFIDLVFYNYILKCFVLIDLKIGSLTHQDIGQMDMYVRMFEDLERKPEDNPTIGIILCNEKDKTVVKYSMLKDNAQLFASTYQLYLPTEKELEQLINQDRNLFEGRENE